MRIVIVDPKSKYGFTVVVPDGCELRVEEMVTLTPSARQDLKRLTSGRRMTGRLSPAARRKLSAGMRAYWQRKKAQTKPTK